jgi:predicted ATPase
MITVIGLANCKCFEQLELQVKPLSLLCGLNGMGKSTVIQALLVLRQSFLSGELTAGRLVLGGELADLGAGADILFEDAASDVLGFKLEWRDLNRSRASTRRWAMEFVYEREADHLTARPLRRHRPPSYVPMLVRKLPPFGGPFSYIAAERIGPRKTHALSETRGRAGDLGPHGEFVMNFLYSQAHTTLDFADARAITSAPLNLGAQVDSWLREVTPGVHLEIEPILAADAVIGGFRFDRPGDISSRRYRATNVGFGLSYALPIVVALLATPPGGLVLLENPEAHIHPRGQTKLGELAARAAAVGVQTLVETHSDHFMDGIRIAVREGIVRANHVSFHYFERTDKSSHVTSPTIDTDGRLSVWPTGFFDEHEGNLSRLLAPKV